VLYLITNCGHSNKTRLKDRAMKFLSALLLFAFSTCTFGQLNDLYLTRLNQVYITDDQGSNFSKESFLDDGKWNSGMVSIINGKDNLLQELRYNISDDVLEVRVNGNIFELDHTKVDSFYIQTKDVKYQFVKLDLSFFGLEKTNYIQQLNYGPDYSLYKYFVMKKKKSSFNPVLNSGKKASVKIIEKYGFTKNNLFKELPNSGRKRKKIFRKIPIFKNIIADNDYDFSKENDLINLFAIVNK